MKKTREKTAYTFIELSIVLALISLVAALIIIGGAQMLNSSKLASARSLTLKSPVREIPDLALWLETTLKDSFLATERDSTTAAIATWYDQNPQSDNKSNATQSTSANRPTYSPTAMNGLPGLFFDSSNDGMTISTNLYIGNDYTVFIVLRGSSSTGRSLQAVNNSINWLLGSWSGTIGFYGGTGWVNNSTSIQSNKIYIADGVKNSTTTKFYVNGAAMTSSNFLTSPGNFALGAAGNYNEPMNGYIGEVIVFSRALSDAERTDIENYLAKKWRVKFY